MDEGSADPARSGAFLSELFDVRDRRVVVTGAANGLGLAISEALVTCGARVTMVDRDAAALEAAQARLSAQGPVRGAVADVTDAVAVDQLFDDANAEMGGLDVVYANAGIGGGPGFAFPAGQLETFDLATFARVMDVNLVGAMLTLRAAARIMNKQHRGKIIVTASATALRPEPMVSYAYRVSKGALLSLVEQAAIELARHGVTVNAMAPGPLLTSLSGRPPSEAQIALLGSTVGLGRMARPGELSGLAVLLASPASDFMTGSVIAIDGGAVAGRPGPASNGTD